MLPTALFMSRNPGDPFAALATRSTLGIVAEWASVHPSVSSGSVFMGVLLEEVL